MKRIIRGTVRIIALVVAIVVGSIPFLVSFICGAIFRRIWIAYVIGFSATIAITVFSSMYPEIFRFGITDLKIHDSLYIRGIPPLLANCGKNLFLAYVGVLTGFAARDGYRQEIEQGGGGNSAALRASP